MSKAEGVKVNLWDEAGRVLNTGGRPVAFEQPLELWLASVKYFEWAESNPILEQKVFHNQGEIVKTNVTKVRAMTIKGLYTFLGIGGSTFSDYANNERFSAVVKLIKDVIYEQKFSGAAAGVMNSNIIARDLGLGDKLETTHVVTDSGENEW